MVQIYKTKTGELFYLSCQKIAFMRILFVAATDFEVESLKLKVESQNNASNFEPSTLNFKLLNNRCRHGSNGLCAGPRTGKKPV
jgi:hypothetical protein